MVFGRVTQRELLRVTSHMPENGVVFSDSMEGDFLEFHSGVEATLTVAKKKGYLVV